MSWTDYIQRLNDAAAAIDVDELERIIAFLKQVKKDGNTVFVIGNGGSAATAEHIAVDWTKGAGLRTIALTSVPMITALANDASYLYVFFRQLFYYSRSQDDVLLAISASGNSENILSTVQAANDRKMITIGMTGFDGGRLLDETSHYIHVPINDYQIVEDVHMMVGHYIMQRLRD